MCFGTGSILLWRFINMNNKKIAEEILTAIGGNDNIDTMAHCATRLRLY